MHDMLSIPSLVPTSDFPILSKKIHGHELVYLDSAATSQKPSIVIDAIGEYYRNHNANVHRGVHTLGDESTTLFHESRKKIAAFFHAAPNQLIVSDNATAAFNHLARWWQSVAKAGDVIVITELEHHSNLVPWQVVAEKIGAIIRTVPVIAPGVLDLDALETILKNNPVKIVAFSHVSNSLGTLNELSQLVPMIRTHHSDAMIVVDGTQGAAHVSVNINHSGVDAYVVSAHKMLGPMGIGGMVVSKRLLAQLTPFNYGGGMIDEVTLEKSTFIEDKEELFTAGTPDVAGLVGWATACEYLTTIGMENIVAHDRQLVSYALEKLQEIKNVEVVGPLTSEQRVGSVTFLYHHVHSHDVGQVLDSFGVAVRSGHHCAMPLHTKFGWAATTRASFAVYNSSKDVDALADGLSKVAEVFGVQ